MPAPAPDTAPRPTPQKFDGDCFQLAMEFAFSAGIAAFVLATIFLMVVQTQSRPGPAAYEDVEAGMFAALTAGGMMCVCTVIVFLPVARLRHHALQKRWQSPGPRFVRTAGALTGLLTLSFPAYHHFFRDMPLVHGLVLATAIGLPLTALFPLVLLRNRPAA